MPRNEIPHIILHKTSPAGIRRISRKRKYIFPKNSKIEIRTTRHMNFIAACFSFLCPGSIRKVSKKRKRTQKFKIEIRTARHMNFVGACFSFFYVPRALVQHHIRESMHIYNISIWDVNQKSTKIWLGPCVRWNVHAPVSLFDVFLILSPLVLT